MSLEMKHVKWFIGLGILIILVSGTAARTQSKSPGLPSLESLKTIQFAKVNPGEQSEAVGYSDIFDVITACRAYSRGLDILPQYHEPILTRGETGIAVFRKVAPSVVMVLTGNFQGEQLTDSGLGTGVIIDASGYVLTNWHVLAGYQAAIVILKPVFGTEPGKNSGYGVKLIAFDEQADLALLKISKPPAGLVPVKLGDISSVQVAEDIHIIGHPHGNLWSYSTGVVSQIRDNYDWKYRDGSQHLAKVLQMQTAINPGNSGGPVLDNNSSMLGLVAMSEEGQNLNYAVAIDVIRDFINRSMASRSRGTEAPVQAEKAEVYSGHSKEGLSVIKSVFTSFVSYTVRDSKGMLLELIAETRDGSLLTGLKPNAFGGFDEWNYKLSTGKQFTVRSTGTAPELITAGAGN